MTVRITLLINKFLKINVSSFKQKILVNYLTLRFKVSCATDNN